MSPERPSRLTSTAAGALVASAGLAVLLAGAGSPGEGRSGPGRAEPVTHTVLACPDQPRSNGTSTSFLAGALGGSAAAQLPGGGSFRYGPLGARAAGASLDRGSLLSLPVRAGGAPVLEADGGLAAGLFGFRADADRRSGMLAVVGCSAPRADWWFTGAGATLDHTSTLTVANLDPGPAVVDVRVLGPDGEVETVGTKGITVASGERRVLRLTDVAPQGTELSVTVHASRGRVVAAVADTVTVGHRAAREWLPDQVAPSRVVRLVGLPAGGASRALLVGNPSALESLVDVRVSGRSGSFTPTGMGQIRVPPGAVVSVDVNDALRRGLQQGPVTLSLRSTRPVVASARTTSGSDTSYAAAVRPLPDIAAGPVLRGTTTTVLLTAPGVAARATVTAYDDRGRALDSADLALPAGATRSWKPPAGAGYVAVDPVRGPIVGAVSLDGHGTAEVPLVPPPIRLLRPAVRPALG